MTKSKILGTLIGCAIGDALGLPIEGLSANSIEKDYGKITDYLEPSLHKRYENLSKGSVSDDTDLTLAVLNALMQDGLNMDCIAEWHIKAFNTSEAGYGYTTRTAIKNLINGLSWKYSGLAGCGNGVAMKIAPLAIYSSLKKINCQDFIVNFSSMTHTTSIALSSAYAHFHAVKYCFEHNIKNFDTQEFINVIYTNSLLGKDYFLDTFKDDICERLKEIDTEEDLIVKFGKGDYYVYNSLPFSYAFFLRNYKSIECLYEVVSNGGDTDSNGSIVGTLLGALHGLNVFPDHLVEGLLFKEKIMELGNLFYEKIQ